MKAKDLNLPEANYTMSCNTYPPKSHYREAMRNGHVFPTSVTQAKYFIASGSCLDLLNSQDVAIIELLLNKHGLEGEYQYTKSKTWVRLVNDRALEDALKKEYNILNYE